MVALFDESWMLFREKEDVLNALVDGIEFESNTFDAQPGESAFCERLPLAPSLEINVGHPLLLPAMNIE